MEGRKIPIESARMRTGPGNARFMKTGWWRMQSGETRLRLCISLLPWKLQGFLDFRLAQLAKSAGKLRILRRSFKRPLLPISGIFWPANRELCADNRETCYADKGWGRSRSDRIARCQPSPAAHASIGLTGYLISPELGSRSSRPNRQRQYSGGVPWLQKIRISSPSKYSFSACRIVPGTCAPRASAISRLQRNSIT